MIKHLMRIFVLSSILLQTIATLNRYCPFGTAFDIYVTNRLPTNSPTLLVHCASKDDDLGNHTLTNNQEFHFGFCDNSVSTLFFCTLWWDKKRISFDAFKETILKTTCYKNQICYWAAFSDGIYYSDDHPPQELTKMYDW
ncbi:hypothetical protein PHJA_002632600 [Phtheirospermum japonicum]|uniref:S-protein homolog n=1 Tax=Phtheirospermum japonicum TaxID=374723 RepID=A0A830D8I5_9LAMI|nr:hypothetical protein PHJA_002632600 [Phtheirospermum japonicum]